MLRLAIFKDIDNIYRLIQFGANSGKVLSRSRKDIKDNLSGFFVCEVENQIVGCCSLDIYNKKLAEVRSLVVRPEFQRRGIGSKLVKMCIKKARLAGVYEVLSITDQDKFFEKFGFSKTLHDQWPMFIKLKKR